ncbi:MAG: glycosyltransferase family 4 protein [Gammaproteobacteria bacterium]
MTRPLTVMQLLPDLEVGGVEQGTLEIAEALVAAGHRAIVVSAGGRLVPALERVGATHLELPIGRKRPTTLRLAPVLRAAMRAERVDVVHARSRLPAWIGRLAWRGLPAAERPHWVTTVHGPYTVNRYSRIMVSGERVIAISAFIRDYILASYPDVPAARIALVPRGIDPHRYPWGYRPDPAWLAAWQSEHPRLAGRRVLCLPARLTRWKGQLDFIEMTARLIAAGQPVHGLIVGGPHPRKREYEAELHARVQALGLAGHVTFLGQRSDLREILAVTDCVYSLTREPEAFGRTTVEALGLGRPVIGYDHGGTGEILREVFPAGRVPTGDIAAAAQRTVELLAACPEVPRTQPFTLARMQTGTLAVYAALAADSAPRE